MSENKKSASNKKINIKNKKEAEKVLNKKKNISNKTKEKKTPSTNKEKNKVQKNVNVEIKNKKEITPLKKTDIKKVKNNKKEKKEEKAKLVLPKEWQVNSRKNTLKKSNKKTVEVPDNLSEKLKNSIFEEVNEKDIRKTPQKNNKKKKYISIIIIIIMLLTIVLIFSKYSEMLKENLSFYTEYNIGEKISLKDNSIWYVIEYSDSSKSTVKLLKENHIDINKDGKYDSNDKLKYNSSNKAVYDINDKESLAYYLEHTYKNELSKSIGTINNISILTSSEFIKARKAMGYGYEWTEGNWLASNSLSSWWITSAKDASVDSTDNKIYTVNKDGTYKLIKATANNYVRPVITVEKSIIEKKD